MKNTYFLMLIGVLTLFCCSPLTAQNPSEIEVDIPEYLVKYVPKQLYWQVNVGVNVPTFKDVSDVKDSELNQVAGLASVVKKYSIQSIEKAFKYWNKADALSHTYKVHFKDEQKAKELLKEFEALSATVYSEQIPLMETFMPPNDPLYSQQWHLPQINAEDAWATNDCSGSSVVIAIVDDAILTTHEDLTNKVIVVPNSDTADGDSDPNPPISAPSGVFEHGTHVAGIAAAETNNNIGVASIGHDCMIMPIKTKSDSNTNPTTLDTPYDGVLIAIANGADVINMSWGGYGYSSTQAYIMSQAYNAGIVCVAAAGNNSLPFAAYPAAYPHVIGVGASNQSNQIADFSNFGQGIDIMAPGVGILSCTAPGNSSYGLLSGTSMASPIVAGMAALYLCEHSDNPNTNPNTVGLCLEQSALNIDGNNSGFEGLLGGGLIQADASLDCEPSEENDCTPDMCELVPNGDFETSTFADLTEYETHDTFEDGEVCGWTMAWGSPHLYSAIESEENHLRLWDEGDNIGEGAITINELNLIPGKKYCMEYDYAAVNNTVSLDIRLVAEGTDVAGSGTIIDQLIDLSPDATINLWGNDLNPTDYHHRSISFIAPLADFHLLIYPTAKAASEYPGFLLDNLTIRPCFEITTSADEDTICLGTCTQLHADVIGGSSVIWEPAYGLDNPSSYNPVACPDETTTYTVTVEDEVTGCTTSENVTIVVEDCGPLECDDIITVEGICTRSGVVLTAHINGVPIDPNSATPIYTITWVGDNGVDYVNDNPVVYPLGTNYTLKVGVIYQTDPLVCCHYELDLVSEGVLDIDIKGEDTICQFTCTQLSVNAPPGALITWTPTTGLDDPTSATPIACPLETTTYVVEVYDPISGCTGKESFTIVVDKKCNCEDTKIDIIQECQGLNIVTKVLVNGIAIDPSDLDWIDINWNILNGTTGDIVDENCVVLPEGTDYEVYITYGIDLNVPSECCHFWLKGTVKEMDCVDCNFSLIEECKGKTTCITMVDSGGNPIVPGQNGDYNVFLWWSHNGNNIPMQNPLCIPTGDVYGANLTLSQKYQVLCTNKVGGYIADCCDKPKNCCNTFNLKGISQSYTEDEDIVVNWDPNGAVQYLVEVEHYYQGCGVQNCTFTIGGDETFVSLAAEGCFNVCETYQITVTAICADGKTEVVALPPIFAYPGNGQPCKACSEGEGTKKKTNLDQTSIGAVTLYPNPANNILNINFGAEYAYGKIEIFDMSGKLLQLVETRDVDNSLIDVSDLESAIYVAKINLDNQESIFTKFVIVK